VEIAGPSLLKSDGCFSFGKIKTTWKILDGDGTGMYLPEHIYSHYIPFAEELPAEYVLTVLQHHNMRRIILVTSPFHQLRTYLTFAKVFQRYRIEIINYYANTGEWHPLTWFFSKEHRDLAKSETERIKLYRAKGDIL